MITLTEEQANEIVRRMDMAIRAGGALAAEPLMPIIFDWRRQAQQAQQEANDRQARQKDAESYGAPPGSVLYGSDQ